MASVSIPASDPRETPSQAVVTLDGRDIYLGRYGSPQSRAEFDRLLAEWLSNGLRLQAMVAGSGLSINDVVLAYLRFADGYYVKNGKPTTEAGNIRAALRAVRELYGQTMAGEFGPIALKTVRQALIESGICRSQVNNRVGRIVRAF